MLAEPTELRLFEIVREAYEGLQERFGRPADEARQIVAERFQLSPAQAERAFGDV